MKSRVALFAVVLMLGGCSNAQPPAPLTLNTDLPAEVSSAPVLDPDWVTYKITSNGTTALITYTDDGSIEQAADAKVPWSWVTHAGTLAQVSAQDGDGTVITCTIADVNGVVVSQHTASGPYAIVSCQH